MKKITALIEVLGKYKIYVEEYQEERHIEKIMLVNGALATTASFGQSVRYLRENLNVVLYDLPYAGNSRPYNDNNVFLTKDEEVEILLALIERFEIDYLASVSWGGVATLLALAAHPASVKKAIITSFSPRLNDAMLDYLLDAHTLMAKRDSVGGARLLNGTVGKYLPTMIKMRNYQYLSSLGTDESAYEQVIFHIRQILSLNAEKYINKFSSISTPVLFINGELDQYTAAEDVRELSEYIAHSQFAVVPQASHFLELESKHAWRAVRELSHDFLFADAGKCRETLPQASDDLSLCVTRGSLGSA